MLMLRQPTSVRRVGQRLLSARKSEIPEISELTEDYAAATTDTAFKHLLGSADNGAVACFLNACIPFFRRNNVKNIVQRSTAIPTLKSRDHPRQRVMDIRVLTEDGTHVLVEMQARRHINFDERALFYACNAFGRQLTDAQMQSDAWYTHLKPVIAVQVLGYDSNRVVGIKSTNVADTLKVRVEARPMRKKQFMKKYSFSDRTSGQTLPHLQLIQIELPRADAHFQLFPPKRSFTKQQWWLSLLSHSEDYTREMVNNPALRVPAEIKEAFQQLDLQLWGTSELVEYKKDLIQREEFAEMFEAERMEGIAIGKMEGWVRMISNGVVNVDKVLSILTQEEIAQLEQALKEATDGKA